VPGSIITTPGASAASDDAARLGSGSPASICRSTACAMLEDCDSVTGADSTTSTVEVCSLTRNARSMARVWLTCKVSGPRVRCAKPTASASIR
jgi:hypothetical protein